MKKFLSFFCYIIYKFHKKKKEIMEGNSESKFLK